MALGFLRARRAGAGEHLRHRSNPHRERLQRHHPARDHRRPSRREDLDPDLRRPVALGRRHDRRDGHDESGGSRLAQPPPSSHRRRCRERCDGRRRRVWARPNAVHPRDAVSGPAAGEPREQTRSARRASDSSLPPGLCRRPADSQPVAPLVPTWTVRVSRSPGWRPAAPAPRRGCSPRRSGRRPPG
jgi:hypothetical protein